MGTTKAKEIYRLDTTEALAVLHSRKRGLDSGEVSSNQAAHGPNSLPIARRESTLHTYVRQYKDWMIILLLVSSVISFLLEDPLTALMLMMLVLFNTTLGFIQECKAERIMESLAKLIVPDATVVRSGVMRSIPSLDITVGDIIYIEQGMAVPADARLIEEHELSTNDFALTGESNPSRKFTHAITQTVPLGNRGNLVYMGTTVATGHGIGVVTEVGVHSELGRIANLSQAIAPGVSPLQKEMNNVTARVAQGTVIVCAILLPIAVAAGLEIKDAFLFAIGIAASIIPQGLPAETNTALAQAAHRLAKARALVKKLSSVETLGATDIILTDKTGTLTKNQMTVKRISLAGTTYLVTGDGYDPHGSITDTKHHLLSDQTVAMHKLFFAAAAMASNARVCAPDDEHPSWYIVGDPTEGALITMAAKAGLEVQSLDNQFPELKSFAFDSGRKRTSSIRRWEDGRLHVFTKGAPETVVARCTHIWENGIVRRMMPKERDAIRTHDEKLAGNALHNIGVAYRQLPEATTVAKLTMESAEENLVWLGMASLTDPLRDHVPNAMEAARKAHIRVSIITGDHAVTAKAIAVRAKLAGNPDDIIVVSGEELQSLSNAHVLHLATRGGVVFSRVTPEDKLRIVELVRQHGKVVAITGDGINDAPALRRADIGVAMGLTGTDTAKQSAEIILLDDSFTTLIHTVQEGRTIFQNIRKSTLACFTSNAAELVVMLASLAAATLFGVPLALSIMLILAIDLVAELLPIAALGRDKADGNLMRATPRAAADRILNRASIVDLVWCGLLIGGFAFANYLLFFTRYDVPAAHVPSDSLLHMKAMALTYLTIVLCQLANILQRRSSAGLFTRYQLHNRQLWLSIVFSIGCVIAIIYSPLNSYFHAGPLSGIDWLYAFGAVALFIAIREFQRHDHKHKRKTVTALHREHRLRERAAEHSF